jgi:hypothetical protein|tara:strand:+ start:1259 stop:1573 length:315 start_codon:yes stop_codon:yes gene_type:complete
MGMGKGQMPAMPAPVVQEAPKEEDYLPEKTPLPDIPQVSKAKLDADKRRKMQRLASTDTRESNITNIGGALGDGMVDEGAVKKLGLYVTPKTIGKSSTKGLLSS